YSDTNLGREATENLTEIAAEPPKPEQPLPWLADLFPTPDRDQLRAPTATPQQPEPDYRTQVPPPPPLVDPEFDQPAKASGDAKASDDLEESPEAIVDEGGIGVDFLRTPVGLASGVGSMLVLIVVATGGGIVWLKARRRARRRRHGAPHERIANGWREVTDLAVDMGRPVPAATTRREAAVFVGPATLVLADRTDAAVWGGARLGDAEVDAYWTDLERTLREMKSELGVVDRLKVSVSLQSLKRVRPGAAVSGRREKVR
ncbi:MAG: hypothetical protein ACO307_17295, partial [Ilumatobacteraceae bacterium]